MLPGSMTWKRVSNKITDLSLPILKFFKHHARLGASVKLQFSALFWRCLREDLFARCQLPERQSRRKPPENRADEILRPRLFHLPPRISRNALPRSTTQSARLRKMSFTPLRSELWRQRQRIVAECLISGTPNTWPKWGKLQRVVTWSSPQKIFETEWEHWRRPQLLIWLWCRA